jgi:hypothetical protein
MSVIKELENSGYDWVLVYGDREGGMWADTADGGRVAWVSGNFTVPPHLTANGPQYLDMGQVPDLVFCKTDVVVGGREGRSCARMSLSAALAAGFTTFRFRNQVLEVKVVSTHGRQEHEPGGRAE